jgi:hypothetical protein
MTAGVIHCPDSAQRPRWSRSRWKKPATNDMMTDNRPDWILIPLGGLCEMLSIETKDVPR